MVQSNNQEPFDNQAVKQQNVHNLLTTGRAMSSKQVANSALPMTHNFVQMVLLVYTKSQEDRKLKKRFVHFLHKTRIKNLSCCTKLQQSCA